MKKFVENGLLLFALSGMLSGCSSMRFSTTLKPQPDPGTIFGDARFCISEVKVTDENKSVKNAGTSGNVPFTTAQTFDAAALAELRHDAATFYPSIFSEDVQAVPLTLNVDRRHSSTFNCFIFPDVIPSLLGILPLYDGWQSAYHVGVVSPVGTSSEKVSFTRRDAKWTSLETPLGLFPVWGHADYRCSWNQFWSGQSRPSEHALRSARGLTYGSLTEAAWRSVRSFSRDEVGEAYRKRGERLQSGNVNGRNIWLWGGYVNEGLHVWAFDERPTYSRWTPLDDIVFHPNPDGTYSPVLMRKPPYFTEISVKAEPGKISMKADAVTPALESLLALVNPNAGGAGALDDDALITAITQALVSVKNTELPTLIVQSPVDKRVAVMSTIEQRLLEAQQHLVLLNGRAEDAVRQGQNAAGFRQKSARIQAYMSVLAEIKNLLMQS